MRNEYECPPVGILPDYTLPGTGKRIEDVTRFSCCESSIAGRWHERRDPRHPGRQPVGLPGDDEVLIRGTANAEASFKGGGIVHGVGVTSDSIEK